MVHETCIGKIGDIMELISHQDRAGKPVADQQYTRSSAFTAQFQLSAWSDSPSAHQISKPVLHVEVHHITLYTVSTVCDCLGTPASWGHRHQGQSDVVNAAVPALTVYIKHARCCEERRGITSSRAPAGCWTGPRHCSNPTRHLPQRLAHAPMHYGWLLLVYGWVHYD